MPCGPLARRPWHRGQRWSCRRPPAELQALIDYDRFRQILANLIGNALKFTPSSGRITIFAKITDAKALQIIVADTGVGIPAEDIPRILEPFVQLENDVHESAHGAGLGLPIVKQLVEAHGGWLGIESALGQGTRVTIALPAGSAGWSSGASWGRRRRKGFFL